ncbi:WxL protein peptidoglycan domain-containing protein [Agromyces sp. Marseille-Q5079]|uniref:WxL protein peptidoglycan domain-containing protein n=1 Tax=Agromyces sp. Marseille-Q5079 TaxID=3439059 RepID=UPI003D9CA3CA
MTRFRFSAGLAALVTVAGLAVGLAGAAPAVAEEAAPVSWSVTPADASGPDGRVAVEHEIDPAASADDRFAVRNLGSEEITFRLAAADGFTNDNGRFDMLPSDQESVDSGTWITLPESVTVAPGGTAVVPFTIAVPEDAQPGDHAAGITASILSVKEGEGTGVGVESRVGFRVMTRVAGELAPAYSVQHLEADYRTSWNPLRPGSIDVVFDVVNEGNARLAVAGLLSIAGRTVAFPAEGESPQEILPGESRSVALTVSRVWPLFAFPGEVALSPTVISASGEPTDEVAVEVASSSTDVLLWAVPWPQLLVLVGLALIILALLWRRGRSKRNLEALLTEAREEGRRSMAGVGQG